MLTFNGMLENAGLELRDVRLLRHSERERPGGRTPYTLWRTDPETFDRYNAIMKKDRFKNAKYTAVFIVTPSRETVFACIYRIVGCGSVLKGVVCPVKNVSYYGNPNVVFYDIERADLLAEYEGRIIIDWGPGSRSWSQRADRQKKSILEIRTAFKEPSFPGWRKFAHHIEEISSMPEGWKEILRNTAGVYLLVHQETGRQYVGSAYGENGFWGRWRAYEANGHGGNVELKKLKSKNFVVTVLETVSSSASIEEVIAVESAWKEKLGSRAIGLNAN